MADNYVDLPKEGSGSAGVSSLNGETGAVSLVAGAGISITPAGQTITIASTSGLNSIGTFDSQSKSANALVLSGGVLYAQSADASFPGMVTIGTQTFAGTKTFTGSISASNLSGTNTGNVTIGTANGLSLAGQVLSLALSSTSTTGALSSTDWNTFNGKQASGNYITALTGDVTATGPGSVVATIAVGAVTDTKGSLAVKPAVTVVATTNQALTGTPTIDGVATAVGSVILLTAQSTPFQNGPWVAAAGAWSRPTWYPSGGTTQAFQFITTFVRLGTVYQGSTWRQTAAAPIIIDTTATTWVNTPLALNSTTVTGMLPILNGGTGATTAAGARVTLNIDERTTFSNANYVVLSTDRYVAQIGTMSAPRTVTLPLANSVNAGQQLIIIDESGTVDTTNTITLARSGSDTINGATSGTIRTAYGRAIMYSDGSSKWTDPVLGVTRGGTGLSTLPTNGQLLIGNTTTSSYNLSALAAGPGITITNGAGTIQVNNSSIGVGTLPPGFVGDGVDGDVTISGPVTLTRDMFYNNLTVNAGQTLNPGGFVIRVKNTLTIAATGFIARNGTVGGNSPGNSAGAGGSAAAGTTVGAGNAGANGGAGQTGAGSAGGNSAGISGEGGVGGIAGNGGSGNGGANLGGSAGAAGAVTARFFRDVSTMWKYVAVGTYMPLGSGGGGGGGGGGDGVQGGRGGGGGGGAGGAIFIICDMLANSGTIQAKGGGGGGGGAGAIGNAGGGGGGSGGGGGKIMLLATTISSVGTLDVTGGAGGTGSTGNGTGTAGANGAAGGAGFATRFEASTGTWTTTS